MKVLFKIIFCGLIFCACANNAEQTRTASSKATAEAEIDNYIDSLNQKAIKSDTPKEESKSTTQPINTPPPSDPDQGIEDDAPRKGSTIAEQQEAARRIQNELARRSPMPNEEKVQEGAVFEKIISTKKETPKATPVNTKKEAAPKPSKKKSPPKKKTKTGNAPLEIKSASATCGCTQPSYPFIPVEPNEQGHISVRYNSVGKEGHQKPEVSIITNIDKNEIILFMEGFVIEKEEGK